MLPAASRTCEIFGEEELAEHQVSAATSKTEWEQFHDVEAPDYDGLCFTQNAVAEVEFLTDVLGLAPGSAILDLACGTGRHSIELARRGHAVTGLDISAGMLAQAQAKAKAAGVQVEWIRANACHFTPAKRFDAALCLCEGAFGLLGSTDDAIEQPLAILRNIAASLKPGGRALFTILNGFRDARRHSDADVQKGSFDPMTLTTVGEYPPAEGAAPIRLVERSFVPTEVRLLFRIAGMKVVHVWGGTAGNWGRRPLELDEMEIMVVAELPRS